MKEVVGEGIGRVTRAPAILVGLWVTTALVTLPVTLTIRESIRAQLGSSVEAASVASGANYDWLQEFMGQASGASSTVRPTIVGFAAVLDNLSALADSVARPFVVTSAGLVYLVLLTFLAPGIIDRLARDRAVRAHGFFSACGGFFFRFVRLGVLAAIAYGLLFKAVHPWLFETVYTRLTGSMTSERTAFLTRVMLYIVFAVPLGLVNLLFDYAKVRAVVEDRRSMLGALSSAAAFIRRNAATTMGVYLIDVTAFVSVIAVYGLIAPGFGSAGWSMWLAFATGQVYVLARLWVKLLFWATETALFQRRLAHARYVRRREPVWPDSPAAEAIAR